MNCFQIVKLMLDSLYIDIPASVPGGKDRAILQALNQLQKDYKAIHSGSRADYNLDIFDPFLEDDLCFFDIETKIVDYSDPATKFAYVYKYLASHADMIYQCLEESPAVRNLFDRDKLKIRCIGCGPGSDLLGILKFCAGTEKSPELAVTLYDRNEALWTKEVNAMFKILYSDKSVKLNINALDMTNANTKQIRSLSNANLFTIVYFVSEVYADEDNAARFFNSLFDNMKAGAMVLFIDNGTPADFYEWFDDLANGRDLRCVGGRDAYSFRVGSEEQKTDLELYYDKYSKEHQPKLTSTISYRIYRK